MKLSLITLSALVNGLILLSTAIYFFIAPLVITIHDIQDPSLKQNGVPEFTYRWHKTISKKFPQWVNQRLESNRASQLGLDNISGTEWPMFSAVYYLWATENLQSHWLNNPSISDQAPAVYAKDAIRAAAKLIADKGNAAWVIKHWGDDYLEKENLFYRMLLISGLTSYETLSSDKQYHELLATQTVSLTNELESSPFGLLDDYPNQCYPIDIVPAISAIARAQSLIGEDFSREIKNAQRGFKFSRLDPVTNLPAYIADAKTGVGYGPARGVAASYMLIWSPEIWPELSKEWYQRYETHFWQQNRFIAGVREFSPQSSYPEWGLDVDSGPIISGFGTAASAFGIAAARANGQFDHAYLLSTEALVSSWPLPDGTLLIPRLLSNLSDAPYIGETALMFVFSRLTIDKNTIIPANSPLPGFVYTILLIYFLFGALFTTAAYKKYRVSKRNHHYPFATLQPVLWGLSALFTLISIINGEWVLACLFFIFTILFPIVRPHEPQA